MSRIDFLPAPTRCVSLRAGRVALLLLIGCALPGCATIRPNTGLPSRQQVHRDQLIVHSDFRVPRRHRLLDELCERRNDIREILGIAVSDEPIHVFLFEDQERFESYLESEHPNFPNRRAFFVKTDTELKVYAFWGEKVAEDLRHEVTHGYLHSVLPDLPVWLDEGIAEYFETPRGESGFNRDHVYLLANRFRRGEWQPDLAALERITPQHEMNQIQYAEAWLWTHFLIHHHETTRQLLESHLETCRLIGNDGRDRPLSQKIPHFVADPDALVVAHLRELAEKM